MSNPNTAALKELQDAEKKRTHNIIYLCEPTKLPELHRLIVESVQLDPDPNAGDIYNHSLSKKWCINHQGKLKLALAAAIEWDTVETKPVLLQRDYVHFQAVGQIRREYGRCIKFRGDFEFDLLSLKEDLMDKYVSMANSMISNNKLQSGQKETWVRDKVQRDYAQKRQHRLKLAATGAKSVVIDKLLNLKSGYKTPSEAAGPYLIVRCQVAPDLSNPEVQKQLSLMSLQAAAGIFGQPRQISYETPDTITVATEDYTTIDETPMPPMDDDFSAGDPGATPDFETSDKQTRIDILRTLAKKKRYDIHSLTVPLDEMSERNLARFYAHLNSLEG